MGCIITDKDHWWPPKNKRESFKTMYDKGVTALCALTFDFSFKSVFRVNSECKGSFECMPTTTVVYLFEFPKNMMTYCRQFLLITSVLLLI